MGLLGVPPSIDEAAVRSFLAGLPGVTQVHDLHIWPMSTTEAALTAHLVMAWESGRWLVDDWSTSAGPWPMPPSDGTFASAAEVAEAVAWPAAGAGGEG